MQTHQKTKKIKNKKSIFEISNYKKASDLSTDNLQFSNFSTKLTNTNINNDILKNLRNNTPLLINPNFYYNTINEYSDENFNLSKINLECDIYISSLKKKLAMVKQNRKEVELNVINIKKKINDLQDKEKKSFKQLECTKKYINKIKKNSKNNNNKNYGIIITKINNIYQNNQSNKNRGNIKLNINNSNNHKKLKAKNETIIPKNHKSTLSHLACYTAIKDNNKISNKNLNSNNNLIKKKKIEKPEGLEKFKICSSPISNKIYIKKTITSIRKTKNYRNIKDNLIKNIKKDIDEKLRIEREISKINREQNKLYNNFYENFVILRSAKTLDVDDNMYN